MPKKKPLLLIMRHAKSDQNSSIRDFDRPLNSEGHRQAQTMGEKITARDITIDNAIISPSLRTTQTFDLVCKGLINLPEARFDERLYNASLDDILAVLQEETFPNTNLLIVAHCPGVIEIVLHLTGEHLEFKTANVAVLCPLTDQLANILMKPRQFCLQEMITAQE